MVQAFFFLIYLLKNEVSCIQSLSLNFHIASNFTDLSINTPKSTDYSYFFLNMERSRAWAPANRGCGVHLCHCTITLFKGKVALFKALFKQSGAPDKGI